MDQLPSAVLSGIAGGIAAILLFKTASREGRTEGEDTVVEYGTAMKVMAVLLVPLAAGITVAALYAQEKDHGYAAALVIFFWAAAAYLIPESFRVRMAYGPSGIRSLSPWRKERFVPWEEAGNIHYDASMSWWVLSTRNQGKIRLHRYLSGVPEFIEYLERRKKAVA